MKIIIIKDDGTEVKSENFMIINYVPDNLESENNFTIVNNVPIKYLSGCLVDVVNAIDKSVDEKMSDCDKKGDECKENNTNNINLN